MRKLLVILTLLVSQAQLRAQDFHLSMYDAAPMFLNPAMTGVVDADWRIHGHYRTQWRSVNFKPYQTALISLDKPYGKWGFGGQIINYRAGFGNYNALQGLFSVGYTVSIDANKTHNVSFGTQVGLTQKSVQLQRHSYNNQYTTVNGGSFNTGLPNNESFAGDSFILPDVNAGVLYYSAAQQSRLNPFLGFSAFNLLTPEETFLNGTSELPMRFYAHTGTRINITETFYVIPKVLFMMQEEFRELTLAADAGYFMKGTEFYLLGGLIYRNRDSFILSLGAKKDNYIAKISYDINTSSLAPASTGRGGLELSFTYMKRDKEDKKEKICPRL